MAAKVCAKRPLCQPPLFPPAWGVDSPAIWNSFLGPMVTHGGGRGEAPLERGFPGVSRENVGHRGVNCFASVSGRAWDGGRAAASEMRTRASSLAASTKRTIRTYRTMNRASGTHG